jgi:hypothetical protein
MLNYVSKVKSNSSSLNLLLASAASKVLEHIFIPKSYISRWYKVDMASQEGQMICGECGAPMGDGVIQPDGTIRFVCTKNSEHILFVTQNN